ncbi:CcmA Integral membrane protein CcmA involved in cell shape determination [Paracoccaceae bacterium]|jgi:cytoskeletal protein CcmA (bactofilin family)
MFSKSAEPTTAPPPPTRPPVLGSNSARSVLGADLRITGEISSSGTVEIQGEIDGNITANGLIIGHEGRVKGSITASSVEIKGQFSGKVACESFTLRSTAVVKADITSTGIVIESGAQIEGRFLKPKG